MTENANAKTTLAERDVLNSSGVHTLLVGPDKVEFCEPVPHRSPTRGAGRHPCRLVLEKKATNKKRGPYRERYGHARHASEARRGSDQRVGAAVRERSRSVIELVQQVPAQPP